MTTVLLSQDPVRASRLPAPGSGRWWRPVAGLAATAAALATAAAVAFYTPTPARVATVTPADGAALATAPTLARLDFTAGATPQEIHLALADSHGQPVPIGAASFAGRSVTIPVFLSGSGSFLLGYHIVLGDGSEATGVTRFTVEGTAGPSTVDDQAGDAAVRTAIAGHSHAGHDRLWRQSFALSVLVLVGVAWLMLRRPVPSRRWRLRI